jgi:hypothetical protein
LLPCSLALCLARPCTLALSLARLLPCSVASLALLLALLLALSLLLSCSCSLVRLLSCSFALVLSCSRARLPSLAQLSCPLNSLALDLAPLTSCSFLALLSCSLALALCLALLLSCPFALPLALLLSSCSCSASCALARSLVLLFACCPCSLAPLRSISYCLLARSLIACSLGCLALELSLAPFPHVLSILFSYSVLAPAAAQGSLVFLARVRFPRSLASLFLLICPISGRNSCRPCLFAACFELLARPLFPRARAHTHTQQQPAQPAQLSVQGF